MTRGTSPFTQDIARIDDRNHASREPRSSTVSKVSTRTADSDQTRSVRAKFKGGRIAQIVGSEVSRVSDYIFKSQAPKDVGPDSADASGYESDSDELAEESPAPQQSRLLRVPTATSKAGTHTTAPKDQPQFHIQGLPSFTSPFQRDRNALDNANDAESPGGTPTRTEMNDGNDPVSNAAAARRAGKSPRLDKMGLPKLDIRAATPDKRRNSYGFGSALDLTRTKSASNQFSEAINGQSIKTGSSRAQHATADGARRPSMMLYNTRSPERSRPDRMVSVQELMRTRVLLLATTIKAGNIAAYCEQFPQPQSSFLYTAFTSTGTSGVEIDKHLPVKRKDEHSLAARHLIAHLQSGSENFNLRLKHFAEETAQELHREVQILQDSTDSTLFPRLEELSERTGQLAQKLTTTSTLAVQAVKDQVYEASRMKRRGAFSFSRALGYKIIECGVIALLWLIWFVVTIVRLVLAVQHAIWALVAWLFFLR